MGEPPILSLRLQVSRHQAFELRATRASSHQAHTSDQCMEETLLLCLSLQSCSACLFRAAQPRPTAHLWSWTAGAFRNFSTHPRSLSFHFILCLSSFKNSILAHPVNILKEWTTLLSKTRACIKIPCVEFFWFVWVFGFGGVCCSFGFFVWNQRLNSQDFSLSAENKHCPTWSHILACLPSCLFLPLLHTCTASEGRVGCAQSHSSL